MNSLFDQLKAAVASNHGGETNVAVSISLSSIQNLGFDKGDIESMDAMSAEARTAHLKQVLMENVMRSMTGIGDDDRAEMVDDAAVIDVETPSARLRRAPRA